MRLIILFFLCASFCGGCSSQVEIIKVELITQKQQYSIENQEQYLQKAFAYYEKENFDSVLVYCHKSYAVGSQNWELLYLYGKTAFKTGRYILADNYLYKALSLCKTGSINRAEIYFALAENENSLGNFNKARQHYLMVIQLNPGSELARTAYKKIQVLSFAK